MDPKEIVREGVEWILGLGAGPEVGCCECSNKCFAISA
jgi:hypothetical protein